MTRRPVLIALAAILAGYAAAAPGPLWADTSRTKPNVVVILADDLGWGDLGCYGASKVKTPHLDRLAAEGIRCTDAHSASAVCSPSRYGLLTGRYCWRTTLQRGVLHAYDPLLIEEGRMTLATVLKSAGYTTGCVGKWHVGLGKDKPDWNGTLRPGPLEVGFDSYFGVPTVNSEDPAVFVENHRVVGLDPKDPIRLLTPNKMEGGTAARYRHGEIDSKHTEKAVAFLEKHRERPFFLYFAPCGIHDPIIPHARFVGTSQCGARGDFIQELDGRVGQVLDALERLKLKEKTLVIFSSDNGGLERHVTIGPKLGVSATFGHKPNGEWRGQKSDIWEGGHRVPFLARWPGAIKAGSRSDQLICLTDLLATVAALTGTELPPDAGPDSFNLLPALREKERPVREALVMHSIQGMFAIRQGTWKLILGQGSGGITSGDGVYMKAPLPDPAQPAGQLYDLAKDPGETTNLYTRHPEIVRRLSALLEQYRKEGRSRPGPQQP